MSIKISVIGAGSGMFSLNMIKDLCLTPNLQNSEICFMDIDAERLEAAYTLCTRYSQETGVKLHISRTTDRRECLRNADFVINTILIGGYKGWKEGWDIAKKHGYRFGGSLHVMHDEAFWSNFYQLRMMEEVLLDVLEVCPDAWYIMVANPVMAGITYLKRKYRNAKIVGLCHGYGGIYRVAEVLGLKREYITFQTPGINHFVWLNSFCYKGENAFPILDKWIEEKSAQYFKDCKFSDDMGPKAIDLYRKYGVFPIGDTCTPGGGSWGSWYHTSNEVEKEWNEDPDSWFKWYFDVSSEQVEKVRNAAYDKNIRLTELIPSKHSDEPMIPLIESLACDIERVIIVNIQNEGELVKGVPVDFEVEVPALVSKRGIQGIRTLPLPKPVIAHMYRDRIAPVEMELEAYARGSKDLLTELVMMDPFNVSIKQARQLVDEIFGLPYHEELRKHYK